MKCVFLYNPALNKIKKHLNYILNELENSFDDFSYVEVTSKEKMIDAINKSCEEATEVLCFAGGDGTFNLVTSTISKYDKRPILAYIPSGTANDIASNLKIPKNVKKAVKVICNMHYIRHDVGKIGDNYFVYICGAGTFTSVSYTTHQKRKKLFGVLAYAIEGVKELVKPTLVNGTIYLDDLKMDVSCPIILIVNSRYMGGAHFNRRGHKNDGMFDVIICKKYITNIFAIAKLVILGTRKKDHTKYYDLYRAKHIKYVASNDLTWCLDGEEGPKGSIEIENIEKHIEIIVK